ncbi:glycosyltransferase [Sabulilitoribacter arenilitoris]|uniref:Glycosyltransferase n=2 Tax=Wocania arenilitoris TaxID=2044858 RepID=A0AAE3JLD5_9FLAO|nr:glycosyltransferase [Wocania arenilitoris]
MYNSEHFIKRCLDSILSQKIPREFYEIIVFDDASIDSSKTIVEAYTKIYKNINIYSVQNSGAYVLRNKMLNMAKGKYVYLMDADDYIINEGLNDVLNIAIKQELDIIGFNCYIEHDNYDKNYSHLVFNETPQVQDGLSYLANQRYMRHEIWWYIIKKDFLTQNHITFKEERYGSDVLFTVETFLKAKRLIHAPLMLYKYVKAPNSSTTNRKRNHLLKLISCRVKMIVNLSELINALNAITEQDKLIKQNLSFRRDLYVYMTISDMLKVKIDAKTLKNNILLFRKHNAYPLKDFLGREFPTTKNKIVTFIFSNITFLKTILFLLKFKKNLN